MPITKAKTNKQTKGGTEMCIASLFIVVKKWSNPMSINRRIDQQIVV